MVKPRLGIAGKALIKANYQGVPIITQPRKERKIREHNTDMTETRAARVEQNTRHKAEPSTLYKVCRGFVTTDVLEKGLSRGAIATG